MGSTFFYLITLTTTKMETIGKKLEFVTPSGKTITIREQNGEDDDILSNPTTVANLRNISHFISAIVVDVDGTGPITVEEALDLPSNDRWAIILQSRIHSIDHLIEFTHDWGKEYGGVQTYEEDLKNLLFNYSTTPTPEELEKKPDAIPYYPVNGRKDLPIHTTSGKELLYDLATGLSDEYIMGLELKDRTKNKELISRNLRLKVGDKFEKVQNFRLFSVKDMTEIRREVLSNDPVFTGEISIENPTIPNMVAKVNIMGIDGFFFQGVI